jgi:hypothetical protein
MSCRRGWWWCWCRQSQSQRSRSQCQCRGSSRCRSDLCLLHGCDNEVVGAGGLGDLADHESEAHRRGHGIREDDHLARLKSSTHTPYLARHCWQNLVDNLLRGIPKVVDCRQTGVQATNEMVMQNNTRVYPGSGRRVGVIPYFLLCFVISISNNVLQARLP